MGDKNRSVVSSRQQVLSRFRSRAGTRLFQSTSADCSNGSKPELSELCDKKRSSDSFLWARWLGRSPSIRKRLEGKLVMVRVVWFEKRSL